MYHFNLNFILYNIVNNYSEDDTSNLLSQNKFGNLYDDDDRRENYVLKFEFNCKTQLPLFHASQLRGQKLERRTKTVSSHHRIKYINIALL